MRPALWGSVRVGSVTWLSRAFSPPFPSRALSLEAINVAPLPCSLAKKTVRRTSVIGLPFFELRSINYGVSHTASNWSRVAEGPWASRSGAPRVAYLGAVRDRSPTDRFPRNLIRCVWLGNSGE